MRKATEGIYNKRFSVGKWVDITLKEICTYHKNSRILKAGEHSERSGILFNKEW